MFTISIYIKMVYNWIIANKIEPTCADITTFR